MRENAHAGEKKRLVSVVYVMRLYACGVLYGIAVVKVGASCVSRVIYHELPYRRSTQTSTAEAAKKEADFSYAVC